MNEHSGFAATKPLVGAMRSSLAMRADFAAQRMKSKRYILVDGRLTCIFIKFYKKKPGQIT